VNEVATSIRGKASSRSNLGTVSTTESPDLAIRAD